MALTKKRVKYLLLLIGSIGLVLIGLGFFLSENQSSFTEDNLFGVLMLAILSLSALIEGLYTKVE